MARTIRNRLWRFNRAFLSQLGTNERRATLRLLLIFTLLVSMGSLPKQPWQWTRDERLRARFDPESRAQRLFESRRLEHSKQRSGDVLNGRRHPELFMPTELFERFVRDAMVLFPRAAPQTFLQESDDLFLKKSEWSDLTRLVVDYGIAIAEEEKALKTHGDVAAARTRSCAAEAVAFRRVRARFGRERFDRFLYTVVAPHMSRSSSPSTVKQDEAAIAELMRRETECQ
jgi:hypothetical protein